MKNLLAVLVMVGCLFVFGSTAYSLSQIIAEPVPEPVTMLLFGTGLVGLSTVMRRRSKKM